MSDENRITIKGHLGTDPSGGQSQNGSWVATLSVGTNHSWKDRGTNQWQNEVEWHTVVLFGKDAEFALAHTKQGSSVLIIGRVKSRHWTDPQGNPQSRTEIRAYTFDVIQKNGRSGSRAQPQQPQQVQPQQAEPQQVQPQQAEPQQVQPRQAEPQQAEPQQVQPRQAEPRQAEPAHTQSYQVQPSQVEEPAAMHSPDLAMRPPSNGNTPPRQGRQFPR